MCLVWRFVLSLLSMTNFPCKHQLKPTLNCVHSAVQCLECLVWMWTCSSLFCNKGCEKIIWIDKQILFSPGVYSHGKDKNSQGFETYIRSLKASHRYIQGVRFGVCVLVIYWSVYFTQMLMDNFTANGAVSVSVKQSKYMVKYAQYDTTL